MRNKIEDLSMSLANNTSSKKVRYVYCNRIQEDETDSYIERDREIEFFFHRRPFCRKVSTFMIKIVDLL